MDKDRDGQITLTTFSTHDTTFTTSLIWMPYDIVTTKQKTTNSMNFEYTIHSQIRFHITLDPSSDESSDHDGFVGFEHPSTSTTNGTSVNPSLCRNLSNTYCCKNDLESSHPILFLLECSFDKPDELVKSSAFKRERGSRKSEVVRGQ